jgi:hypothetical protein
VKLKHAELIVKVAQGRGLDVTLRPDYCPNAALGTTTTGVVASLRDLVRAMLLAAANIDSIEERAEFIDDMGNLSSDQMGKDRIWY